ncbi:MAG: DnaB-like helicase N-terminal domain-containing protein, partial [Roseobacter sp.]
MNEVTAFNPTGVDVQSPETMPHSIEAEQQLLGAILTNNDIYDRVASIIGPKHFY